MDYIERAELARTWKKRFDKIKRAAIKNGEHMSQEQFCKNAPYKIDGAQLCHYFSGKNVPWTKNCIALENYIIAEEIRLGVRK